MKKVRTYVGEDYTIRNCMERLAPIRTQKEKKQDNAFISSQDVEKETHVRMYPTHDMGKAQSSLIPNQISGFSGYKVSSSSRYTEKGYVRAEVLHPSLV